jgi:nicotinate-nucleotide adenylyltransferase
MRIGLFGGTFDPPHNGHIHLILSLLEAHHLDRVLVVPALLNPLKPPPVARSKNFWHGLQASPEHRLTMAHLAFDPVPGCTVLDIDVRRSGPSYMIDTVHWLMEHDKEFAAAQRFLLLGADAAASLPQWRQLDQLLKLVRPLIAARGEQPKDLIDEAKQGWTRSGILDISSTDVRARIHQGLYVDHLVPERVMKYIRESKVYS